jgi:hypothetical protein
MRKSSERGPFIHASLQSSQHGESGFVPRVNPLPIHPANNML